VRSQRFDSSGNKVGSEAFFGVDLNQAAGVNLNIAQLGVTGLAGGGYAVSWSDTSNVVKALLYDSSGNPSGSPITVATANNGEGVVLAPLASGGFVDVWGSAALGQIVSGEVFNAERRALG
jgi:hypothetical protein